MPPGPEPKPEPLAEPAPELVLTEVAQLKAVSDSFRLQLFEAMADEPTRGWTAKELAERLRTKQTKLYHHLNLLEEHGILRVAETRLVSGILEKRYQVVARSFRVHRSLLTAGEGESALGGVLDVIFDKSRSEIVESIRAGLIDLDEQDRGPRRMALSMTHARLSPASVRRVMRLIEKLNKVDETPDPDGTDYGLVVGFYPRVTTETNR